MNEQAAEFCKNNLHLHLIQNDKFKEGQISAALKEAFVETDNEFCERIANESMRAGTTALVCLIEDERRLYLAWAGDSTCILIRDGEPVQLTQPHTAEVESERERIKQMGGECMYTNMWRVMGILAVTRSIGDPDYKPYVTAEPEIVQLDLVGNEDFLVLASDGLWDTLTPEDASTIVYEFLALNADQQIEQPAKVIDEVSRLLIQRSIEEGSSDNITTIVLFLKDLAKISPAIQVKQNGHQNGHHLNGNGLHEESAVGLKENGSNGFPLNVNAAPFSPNNDLFNSISTSGVELIRQQRERAASEDSNGQRSANPINVTSNEDNTYFDDNLSAINDDEMVCHDDEEPHSILPNINQELTENNESKEDDDELQRELDEERVVVVGGGENVDSEPPALEEAENEPEEEEIDEQRTEETGKQVEDSRDLDDQEPIDVEYKLVPGESTASPVDLISESTTDQNEEKGSTEQLNAASPFEQIDDQPIIDANNDVVIKVNDLTLHMFEETPIKRENEEQPEEEEEEQQENVQHDDSTGEIHEDAQQAGEQQAFKQAGDEEDEETSFEFLDNTDEIGGQHNVTQYISPENSKLNDFQEVSVYENARTTLSNEDAEPEDDHYPDSQDSIKYLDKTANDENQVELETASGKEVDDLAVLMQGANLHESNANDSAVDLHNTANDLQNTSDVQNDIQNDTENETENDRTLNLIRIDENDENMEEQNKENLPERILLAPAVQTTLLDSTLLPMGNVPIMSTGQSVPQFAQANEEHFDEEDDEQPRSSNFEMIQDEEVAQRPPLDLETTITKTEDMDITFLQPRTPFDTPTVIDKQVPNHPDYEIPYDNQIREPSLPDEEPEEAQKEEEENRKEERTEERTDEEERNEEEQNREEQNREEEQNEDSRQQPVEPIVEESKDNFEVLEAPPTTFEHNAEPEQLVNDELNRDSNDQLSELKTQPTSDAPEINDKPEIVDEQPKEELKEELKEEELKQELKEEFKEELKEELKEEPVHNEIQIAEVAVGAALAASAVAVATQVAKKASVGSASKAAVGKSAVKTSLTTKATPAKKPLSTTKPATKATPNSTKLTKDSKPTPVKDSKSALARETKSSSTVRSALTSKPLTKRPASTTTASSAAASTTTASKPAATRKPLTTSTTTTRQPLSTSTKPAARPTLSSRAPAAASATSSTLAAKPAASKVASTLAARSTGSATKPAAKPAAKPTVTTSRSTSTLAPKATANSKPTTGTSRPASTVNKYANVTSKVSSTLAKSSVSSTGLTKKPLGSTSSSTLRAAPAKPSNSATKPASTATSRTSAPSKLTSKPLTGVASRLTTKPATSKPTTTTASANKKTAVPRKPVNKTSTDSPVAAGEPVKKPVDVVPATENGNAENNGLSVKPNGLSNGQNGGTLTNGDQLSQSLLNATTPTSITASKSRDKLTNSLKAELEAAMELNGNGLPK